MSMRVVMGAMVIQGIARVLSRGYALGNGSHHAH
jgi:hypothetical protein